MIFFFMFSYLKRKRGEGKSCSLAYTKGAPKVMPLVYREMATVLLGRENKCLTTKHYFSTVKTIGYAFFAHDGLIFMPHT